MSNIKYIEPEDLVEIIDIIRGFDYIHDEEIPDYDEEVDGVDEYFSLIDRIKNDIYYPTVTTKATALFLHLNTTHFFSNGNKRIAAFSLILFLNKNGLFECGRSKEEYKQIFTDIFGHQSLEDYDNFSAADFALYNLALITARFNERNVEFDQGKIMVETFITETFSSVK